MNYLMNLCLATTVLICITNATQFQPQIDANKINQPSTQTHKTISALETANNKKTKKRGLDPALYQFDEINSYAVKLNPWYSSNGWKQPYHLSPVEANQIVAQAKQASASLVIAQQQVHQAQDQVLTQQRLAAEKETRASIAAQKSEVAAAYQRQESATATQNVILAQQRLAAAKSNYAQQQRIAAAKEAAAIQVSAKLAAAEITRAEHEAARLATLKKFEAASAAKEAFLATQATHVSVPLSIGAPWETIPQFDPWNQQSVTAAKPFNFWG